MHFLSTENSGRAPICAPFGISKKQRNTRGLATLYDIYGLATLCICETMVCCEVGHTAHVEKLYASGFIEPAHLLAHICVVDLEIRTAIITLINRAHRRCQVLLLY